MKFNLRLTVGTVLLLGFGVVAFLNFNRSITPYVPFAEARTAPGAVQVAGFPDHAAARFDAAAGLFIFEIKDEAGDVMRVEFAGAQPGNFDQAEKVVVVGRYHEGTLTASQILVKCPSKYDDLASQGLQSPHEDEEPATTTP